MAKLLLSVLASSFLILPLQSVEAQNQPPSYDDAVAYEVYDAALPLNYEWARNTVKTKAIQMETQPAEMCLEPAKDFQNLMGPAISDYVEKNKKTWSLQKQFHVVKPYALLSSDQLQRRRTIDHPEQYANSRGFIEYVRLSAIGFNLDKTIAVLYEEYLCGGLCGHGQFVVLQKKEEKWQPLDWRGISCSTDY